MMGQMVMDEREGDWQRGEGWQRGGEFLMTLAGVYQERHGGGRWAWSTHPCLEVEGLFADLSSLVQSPTNPRSSPFPSI